MKKLMLIALVMGNTFALDANSSWDRIRKARNVEVEASKVKIGKFYVGLFSVCQFSIGSKTFLDGGEAEVCTKTSRGRGERCLETKVIELVRPLTVNKSICSKWTRGREDRCVEYKIIKSTQPLNYNLDVYRTSGRGDVISKLFDKGYSIPFCQ